MSETEMGWTCGCGWNNGINLAVCATCGRTPSEGFGVGFDRHAELATLTAQVVAHAQEIADVKAELNSVCGDWNTIVAAIGSPTHGGAVGRAKQLQAKLQEQAQEIERLTKQMEDNAALWIELRGLCWQADTRREIGGDRTLIAMVRAIIHQRDEARDNRRGEHEARTEAEAKLRAVEALRDQWQGMYDLAIADGPIQGDEVGHAARWEAVRMLTSEVTAILTPEAQ